MPAIRNRFAGRRAEYPLQRLRSALSMPGCARTSGPLVQDAGGRTGAAGAGDARAVLGHEPPLPAVMHWPDTKPAFEVMVIAASCEPPPAKLAETGIAANAATAAGTTRSGSVFIEASSGTKGRSPACPCPGCAARSEVPRVAKWLPVPERLSGDGHAGQHEQAWRSHPLNTATTTGMEQGKRQQSPITFATHAARAISTGTRPALAGELLDVAADRADQITPAQRPGQARQRVAERDDSGCGRRDGSHRGPAGRDGPAMRSHLPHRSETDRSQRPSGAAHDAPSARRIAGKAIDDRTFLQVTMLMAGLCKTVGSAYVGSNPTPATSQNTSSVLSCCFGSAARACSRTPRNAAESRWTWDIRGMARHRRAVIWTPAVRLRSGRWPGPDPRRSTWHHGARTVTRDLLQLSGPRPWPELRDSAYCHNRTLKHRRIFYGRPSSGGGKYSPTFVPALDLLMSTARASMPRPRSSAMI